MTSDSSGLTDDKKQKILEASIREFAQNSYQKVSTNSIIKAAKVSKGLLFHYFGNKQKLFLHTLDYCIDYYMDCFYKSINQHEYSRDVFERLIEWGRIKLKLYCQNPMMHKLITNAFIDIPCGLEREMEIRYRRIYDEGMKVFLKDIDTSLFREDIDLNKALKFIKLSLDTLTKKYIQDFKHKNEMLYDDIEEVFEEFKEYMDMLKYGLYKNVEKK